MQPILTQELYDNWKILHSEIGIIYGLKIFRNVCECEHAIKQ